MDSILSIRNENVEFDYTYGGPLEAEGKGETLETFAKSLRRFHDVIMKNAELKRFFKSN